MHQNLNMTHEQTAASNRLSLSNGKYWSKFKILPMSRPWALVMVSIVQDQNMNPWTDPASAMIMRGKTSIFQLKVLNYVNSTIFFGNAFYQDRNMTVVFNSFYWLISPNIWFCKVLWNSWFLEFTLESTVFVNDFLHLSNSEFVYLYNICC